MRLYKIVIDTNVLIAALRSQRGASFKLLSLIGVSADFILNISVPLILEYEEVSKRQREDNGLAEQDIDDILDYICRVATPHRIFFLWRPFLKDAKDDMVLELAVESEADYIITFNRKDFARVESKFGIGVIGPKLFLQKIGEIG